VSEWAYTFFARRRDLLNRVTRLLWGPVLEPERNTLVSWLFLRLFGAIYIAAFASLGVQVLGLVGHEGILPLGDYLSAARQGWGVAAYWRLPTLFWLDSSDTVLLAAAMIGVVLGLFVTLGIWVRPALIGAFVLYLPTPLAWYAAQLPHGVLERDDIKLAHIRRFRSNWRIPLA